jgi:hypothetical protein
MERPLARRRQLEQALLERGDRDVGRAHHVTAGKDVRLPYVDEHGRLVRWEPRAAITRQRLQRGEDER